MRVSIPLGYSTRTFYLCIHSTLPAWARMRTFLVELDITRLQDRSP